MQVLIAWRSLKEESGGSSFEQNLCVVKCAPVNRIAGLVAEHGAVAHAAHLLAWVDTVDDPRMLPLWAATQSSLTASAALPNVAHR
jgi:hypothetical protein